MPIRKYLENTLHGDSRAYITQCTLASITKAHEKKFEKERNSGGQKGRGDGKPMWLPLPEEVPLRYCKHKDDEGKERGIISEEECLVDLLSGQVKGNEIPKNKNHYILATAEREEEQQKNKDGTPRRRRGIDIREKARVVPGVPIVYVKRSVMILEEMSGSSEKIIRGVEKEKFKEGLIGAVRGLKRKRDDDSDSDSEDEAKKVKVEPKVKGVKGPNPLSVKKKQKKATTTSSETGPRKEEEEQIQDGGEQSKKKNRRRRGKKGGKDKSEEASGLQSAPGASAPASAPAAEVVSKS